ncbi:perlucin-like [Gigantopelta aegis]|uniref:perlucin-like n=1 Tax=Gigantopelta aegis TaxID=1735272 RepID=UPI001B88E694|nr:perlucin-like [Gigantopelta aegis]
MSSNTLYAIVSWLTVLSFAGAYNIRCPNGYVAHDKHCYRFVSVVATWPEAKVMCEAMGAKLLEIDSPWEEAFIMERLFFTEGETILILVFIKHFNYSSVQMSTAPLWIGATDMMNENEWVWMSSGKRVGYRNWFLARPEAMKAGHGHCLALRPRPQFVWDEITCRESLNFICEMNDV